MTNKIDDPSKDQNGFLPDQCYCEDEDDFKCESCIDDLEEERKALNLIELRRLKRLKEKCEKKIEHLEKIKKTTDESSEFIASVGCFGCLFWIALCLILLAGGIYAIKWAWWLLVQVWRMTV